MSPIQRTVSMPCPSPTNSPLVRHEELSQAALMFTSDDSDFKVPVTIFSSGDAEEWKSWIYPEYIVSELQVEEDFFIPPLAPIDDAALSVLLTDHYVHPVQHADAEGKMRVDEVFPLSGDMVDDSLLVPAEPLLSTENTVSDIAPSGDVVTAGVPFLGVNLSLGEPHDVPTCYSLDLIPPIIRDEGSPVPRQAASNFPSFFSH
ncbi:hypothetical protein EXIGLDRAFT_763661 [Exidia glandulosa HHB12029]|uniref:Uncharacterized protein n=1 Tax=Exidia glandulosa HHB12029 TaxID=1314781 RepID=A0A165LUU9_EXIGL|nr:hypothetical protein EXIGLDRAFT_763661 [Exidia glandulosa HHB12029]